MEQTSPNTSGGHGNGQAPQSVSLRTSVQKPRSTTPLPGVERPETQPPPYINTPDPGQFGAPSHPNPTYGMSQPGSGYSSYGAPPPMPYGAPMTSGSTPFYPQTVGYSQTPYYSQQQMQYPYQQQQQQQVVFVGGGQGPQYVTVRQQSFTGHIVLACITFWCCGWMFGLIGFILAMLASDSASRGEEMKARQLGQASLGVSIAGIIIPVVIIVIVVGVVVGGAASTTTSYSCGYYYC